MHSASFISSIPKEHRDWSDFLAYADSKLKNEKGVRRLAENVWLLDLTQSVASLGWLVSLAEQRGIAYGTIPFADAPQWLPAGFDPNTIQDRSGRSLWSAS